MGQRSQTRAQTVCAAGVALQSLASMSITGLFGLHSSPEMGSRLVSEHPAIARIAASSTELDKSFIAPPFSVSSPRLWLELIPVPDVGHVRFGLTAAIRSFAAFVDLTSH